MRPREKLTSKGIDNLSEVELMSLIVGSGTKDRSYEDISKSLLVIVNRIKNGGVVSFDDIHSVSGVGFVTAARIAASLELGKRMFNRESDDEMLRNTKEAVKYFMELMEKKKEYVKALYLNARYVLLRSELISIGSLDKVSVSPRDIVMPALDANAAYVVLGHNHPSGDVTASQSDILLTKKIMDACELVGVKLLDHIIVARGGKWSTVSVTMNP